MRCSEAVTVLLRRYAKPTLKDATHAMRVVESALVGDGFQGRCRALQHHTGGVHAGAFDELSRRNLGVSGEHARKVAKAHIRNAGKNFDR